MALFLISWHWKGRRFMFVYESLTMNIWKIKPIKAGVEGTGVNLGPVYKGQQGSEEWIEGLYKKLH